MASLVRVSSLLIVCMVIGFVARAEDQPPAPNTPAEKKEKEPVKDPIKEPVPEAKPIDIVVTASRLPAPAEKTGTTVSIVRAEVIESTQQNMASEVLQYVPGITIARTGIVGSQTSLFMRGGNSNHTSIMFDGWKVNRQGGAFDFADLDPLAVKSVEVAHGPVSTLFGSDAMTGVVNLITAKGEGRPTLTTSAAGGTYGTERETVSLSGREKKFSYNIASSHLGRHDGPYINSDIELYNYAARLDYDFNQDHSLKFIARGSDLSKEWYESSATGYGPSAESPDPNDHICKRNLLTGLEYRGQVLPIWETTLRISRYGMDNDYVSKNPNPPSSWMKAPYNTAMTGQTTNNERRYTADWQNNVVAYESDHIRNTVTLGFCAERETFDQADTIYSANFDVAHTNLAGYFQNRLELYDRVFLTGGVRREQSEEFGAFITARGDMAILIPESNTRLHGSVGNAFRAPSFYELYAAGMGNADLNPEQNMAWDAGLEQHFWGKKIWLIRNERTSQSAEVGKVELKKRGYACLFCGCLKPSEKENQACPLH
ncbi:MAG: TonB-dependent receptor, partial [Planctomycetota bacterium]